MVIVGKMGKEATNSSIPLLYMQEAFGCYSCMYNTRALSTRYL